MRRSKRKEQAYQKEWRRKNAVEYAKSRRDYTARTRDIRREKVRRRSLTSPIRFIVDVMKAAPCVDCGGRFPSVAMDFDHRATEEKTYGIAVMVLKRHAPSAVFAEIAKCDLVCSNCHRVRTRNRYLDMLDNQAMIKISGNNVSPPIAPPAGTP